MKATKKMKAAGKGAVKRAVSLPPELDKVVLAVVKEGGRTYSSIVRDALDLYVGQLRETELEKSYQAYYSDQEAVRAGRSLADELFSLSKKNWPH